MTPEIGENILERLRTTREWDELRRTLREIRLPRLGARWVRLIGNAIDRTSPPRDVQLAMMGSHTLEPLDAYLRAHLAQLGIGAHCVIAPYGQYMQAVLAEDSPAARNDPDILFLSLAMRDLSPRVAREFASLDAAALAAEREHVLATIQAWVDAAASRTRATLLVCNFPRPVQPALGIADLRAGNGEAEFYLELNLELIRRFRASNRVCVFDLDRIVASVGASQAFSERSYYIAKQPWSDALVEAIARELARYAIAVRGWTRKCAVVDLDGTLWGGVVGEDGTEGLRIGRGEATAEAFLDFQRTLKSLQRRGVLLAVASKNNLQDAREPFERRAADMALRWEDFAGREIGWHAKHESLSRLAKQLNIGRDSLVFLDDNPVERDAVRKLTPDVVVPELPEDPAARAQYLLDLPWFEKLDVTDEDRVRTAQYQERSARLESMRSASSLEEYLAGLGTQVTVRAAESADVRRLHQLFARTNQFNLTTRRYSVGEIEALLRSPRHLVRVVEARDRFGDLGIVGAYLLERRGAEVELDNFCMSCRALGRDIEGAVMNCIKQEVRRVQGASRFVARFIPTPKNEPAKEFLARQGLQLAQRTNDGMECYAQPVEALGLVACEHIRVMHDAVATG